MTSSRIFIGVLPAGGRHPLAYAALGMDQQLIALADRSFEEVVIAASSQPGVLAAIASPSRPGQPGGRLAERALCERGVDVPLTPPDESDCPGWVRRGFRLYRRLQGLGFAPYPDAAAVSCWLEVNPQATFQAILGHAPLPRGTLEGRLQRQLALYEAGVCIPDPMDFFEEVTRHRLLRGSLPMEQVCSPTALDALAAAHTAWLAGVHPERLEMLGSQEEGLVAVVRPAPQPLR